MNQLQELNYQGKQIRMHVDDRGEPWWMASDVCETLSIENHRDAVGRLDEDQRTLVSTDTLGGRQEKIFVSESGVYCLILTSRKDEAKFFRRWITKEVLPSIRKTGQYSTKTMTQSEIVLMNAQALVDMERKQEAQAKQLNTVSKKIEQIEHRLIVKSINQMPANCKTLDWIVENKFPGMTIQNVSAYLHSIGHPSARYEYTDESGQLHTKQVFYEHGLDGARSRLIQEAYKMKETDKNNIMVHPTIGRFFVKKVSHHKNALDLQ